MTVVNVTTLTIPAGGWDQVMENNQKAKPILERHGAKNVRLLVPVAGETSGVVHSIIEADDHTALGKILDAIYADPDMIALMMSGAETGTWTTSTLMEVPL